MIDFQNASVFKLKSINNTEGKSAVEIMLVENEEIFSTFQTLRDLVVFTNKRIISINSQGLTGKKKDYTSLPYSKVQAFSVETSGLLDFDSELELWFSGLGKVRFEFKGSFDIASFNKMLSNYIL